MCFKLLKYSVKIQQQQRLEVPAEGIEPTHPCEYWILSPARLPVPPRRQLSFSSIFAYSAKGASFSRRRAEADAECIRQKTLLERHSREAIGLSPREMSNFIAAKSKLGLLCSSDGFLVSHELRHHRQGEVISIAA